MIIPTVSAGDRADCSCCAAVMAPVRHKLHGKGKIRPGQVDRAGKQFLVVVNLCGHRQENRTVTARASVLIPHGHISTLPHTRWASVEIRRQVYSYGTDVKWSQCLDNLRDVAVKIPPAGDTSIEPDRVRDWTCVHVRQFAREDR